MATLEQDGWAVVENAMSAEWVAEARADLARILESTPYGRDDFEGHKTRRIYALFAKTRTLDAPATHPIVLAALDRVLGHYQLSAPTGIEIGPGETAQPLHPDDAIYPLDRPHQEIVVNAMWPLCDFTAENGGTVLVPGSHRWANEFPGPDTPTITIEMPAGSLLLYSGKPLARRRREPHRPAAPRRRAALLRVVAASGREPRARRAARRRAHAARAAAGAPRLQHPAAVHRLRRRPAPEEAPRPLNRYVLRLAAAVTIGRLSAMPPVDP